MTVAGFKETLREAVRQMSFRTSLESLRKKGVQQVNVLGLDRIIALVEAAMHKSLRSRLMGVEREAVTDATKAEFLRLLRSNEDLQRQKSEIERAREHAEEELDHLRRELAQQQQALRVRLAEDSLDAANRYQGEDAVIAGKVADVVQALVAGGPMSASAVEQRLMELVMEVVGTERQAAEAARRALRDREVENLERRIKKLTESLSTTEHRLQQVAAMKNIEAGISSIYREVQGLSPLDAQAGRKKELMADIFRANLALQKRQPSRS